MATIYIAPLSRRPAMARLQMLDSEIKKTEGQVVMYRQCLDSAEQRLREYRVEAAALEAELAEYHVTG